MPDEAIFPAIDTLDVELLPRFDTVHLTELRRQNDLALGGDGSLHASKIPSYLTQCQTPHGRRNATIVSSAVITTYCFPSLPRYVIGFAKPLAGSFVSHSSFPVFDSYAWNR